MAGLWTFLCLAICAFGVGGLAMRSLGVRHDAKEHLALAGAAGLGLVAIALALLALAGRLDWARWLLPAGAALTVVAAGARHGRSQASMRSKPAVVPVTAACIVLAAALGSLAPTTEYDSLVYPIPIATHLAHEGTWRFWPDQLRSVFPLSQEMLMAPLIAVGSTQTGLISALEFGLAVWLIAWLGRRTLNDDAAGWVAALIALGSPAVAFLVASAKEDLLLLAMTSAAVLSLIAAPSLSASARAGLFAGFAAGSKYTGLPIAFGVVACVPFCCGRDRRFAAAAIAGLAAMAAGGLWYGVNVLRFGNPLAPFASGLGAPLVDAVTVARWSESFGYGHQWFDALVAPAYMAYGAAAFGGRGNWINPLAFVGVASLVGPTIRRRAAPLLIVALIAYVAWFQSIQVSRLLLPALALLSVPAAAVVLYVWRRWPVSRVPLGALLALSGGIVVTVSLVRFERYVRDPSAFVQRETMHLVDLEWMNSHLDPARHRVASTFDSCAYLRVPYVVLSDSLQIEIRREELEDPSRLLAALHRQRITHVFTDSNGLAGLGASLELVYSNPASPVGGAHFFRAPETRATAVFRLR